MARRQHLLGGNHRPHTGFTGIGVWIDFARGLAWTLLTNGVHPTRHRDTGIDMLRRMDGDLIIGQAS
jgi:CubicO group peptidase (beta-lactamase class C family)